MGGRVLWLIESARVFVRQSVRALVSRRDEGLGGRCLHELDLGGAPLRALQRGVQDPAGGHAAPWVQREVPGLSTRPEIDFAVGAVKA